MIVNGSVMQPMFLEQLTYRLCDNSLVFTRSNQCTGHVCPVKSRLRPSYLIEASIVGQEIYYRYMIYLTLEKVHQNHKFIGISIFAFPALHLNPVLWAWLKFNFNSKRNKFQKTNIAELGQFQLNCCRRYIMDKLDYRHSNSVILDFSGL